MAGSLGGVAGSRAGVVSSWKRFLNLFPSLILLRALFLQTVKIQPAGLDGSPSLRQAVRAAEKASWTRSSALSRSMSREKYSRVETIFPKWLLYKRSTSCCMVSMGWLWPLGWLLLGLWVSLGFGFCLALYRAGAEHGPHFDGHSAA